MSIINSRAFNRAHDAYYNIQDDDDFDTCQDCIDGKIPNPDFNPEETNPKLIENETCDCDSCNGTGKINLSEIKRMLDRLDREDRCDRLYDQMKDDRLTRGLD